MGELVALRWHDVRWSERVLVVERALSGDVEGTTKGHHIRYVRLGDEAIGALDRLSRRADFTSGDDYVFANVAGDRLDPSALRRRYVGDPQSGACRSCGSSVSATPPARCSRACSTR